MPKATRSSVTTTEKIIKEYPKRLEKVTYGKKTKHRSCIDTLIRQGARSVWNLEPKGPFTTYESTQTDEYLKRENTLDGYTETEESKRTGTHESNTKINISLAVGETDGYKVLASDVEAYLAIILKNPGTLESIFNRDVSLQFKWHGDKKLDITEVGAVLIPSLTGDIVPGYMFYQVGVAITERRVGHEKEKAKDYGNIEFKFAAKTKDGRPDPSDLVTLNFHLTPGVAPEDKLTPITRALASFSRTLKLYPELVGKLKKGVEKIELSPPAPEAAPVAGVFAVALAAAPAAPAAAMGGAGVAAPGTH